MSQADQTTPITVYTNDNCPYCRMVKAYLETKRASFDEINIDRDPAAGQDLFARTGVAGLPVTFFGDQTFVLGFDRAQIDSCLQDGGWL